MSGIKIKQYTFNPTIIPSIVTFALLYVMISLGLWQLDRADYKANLQTLIESKQGTQPIALSDISKNEEQWLYQPVFVSGTYDVTHQIYLDNQVHNMVAGFSIFTPLMISDNEAILVNRGWLPLGANRTDLPDINIRDDTHLISGLTTRPPSKGLVLSSNANIYDKWPTILQYIDIQEIEKNLNYKLLPMVLLMNHESETPLKTLPIKINMRSEKHTAYAFQWYGLSIALLIIYIVVNTKKLNTKV